jgi:dynein heavy chain
MSVLQEVVLLKMTWDMVSFVDHLFCAWQQTLWAEIDTELLLEETKKLATQLKKLPKQTKVWPLFKSMEERISDMVVVLPLVNDLHSPSMRDRHWKALVVVTHKSLDKGPSFCLDDVISLGLHKHVEQVTDIVEVANKELKVESNLKKIEETWATMSFKFVPYKDIAHMNVLSPPDEIMDILEEHQLSLQSMAGMGKFVDYFREKVTLAP